MALATAKAGPLRPDIKLSQALSDYEAVLSAEQRQIYKKSPPDAQAVMALTCEIDRQNAGRRSRRCGARLTSFLNSVKGFTSIVDLIVSSSGNPIAGGVWGAVRFAIQIASGFETYFDSLSTLLMNVGLSSPRFEKYALLYPTSTTLQKELCNYYSVVVNLCAKILLFVRKPFIKQVASALRKPFDVEFATFQKDLLRLGTAVKEEVSLAAKQQQSLDSIEGARERKENSLFRASEAVFRRVTANELAQARKWREGKIRSRFLNACSKYNVETTLNQARKKGASTWIFETEEYPQWKSIGESSTLLCSGIVGAGKTVLTANVVEDLTLNRPLDSFVSYFFSRSDEAASLKAREIIGSLARQLYENLPTEAFRLNQMDPTVGELTFGTERILSDMLLALPQHKQYFIVLDGLDECEYEEVRELAGSIQTLLESSKHIFKLFWTGRSDFASKFLEELRHDFQVHILPSNNGPEISRFIELALENALENNRLKLRDPKIILQIQEALEVGAHEMFLWVVFQIETICAQNTDHGIINSLKDLPKGLPATFRRILRRLQHSAFADPSLGRKIFEIVAAAQRPLTLEELGDAISITPGDTTWDRSKLVNDVLRSLESCGSFIIVDEELSTVHFAHSSIKRHLLSEPTDLDVRDYHVDPFRADINVGNIIVTYLSLDVLSNQLAKSSKSSQTYTANVPSFVAKSALPKRELVSKVALAILRGRKMSGNEPGVDFERSANLERDIVTQMSEDFSFLPYCQEYWLYHTQDLHNANSDRIWELWKRLFDGAVNTVKLPWAPEKPDDTADHYIGWATVNHHQAAKIAAIHKLWNRHSRGPADSKLGQLENLLRRLHGLAGYSLKMKPTPSIDVLLYEAVKEGYEMVVRLALQNGANINSETHFPLHAVIVNSNKAMAELLINEGADVNLVGGRYGCALQAAAATNDMDSIVLLLLAHGADVNTFGGEHGTALKAAVASQNLRIVSALIAAGANVNTRGPNVESSLLMAVRDQNPDIVLALLDKGAFVEHAPLGTVEEYRSAYGTTDYIAHLIYSRAQNHNPIQRSEAIRYVFPSIPRPVTPE